MPTYTKIAIQTHGVNDLIVAVTEAMTVGVKISYYMWSMVRGITAAKIKPSDGDSAVRILDAEGQVEYAVLNPKSGAPYILQTSQTPVKVLNMPVNVWDVWEMNFDDELQVRSELPEFEVPHYAVLSMNPALAGRDIAEIREARSSGDKNLALPEFGIVNIIGNLYEITVDGGKLQYKIP